MISFYQFNCNFYVSFTHKSYKICILNFKIKKQVYIVFGVTFKTSSSTYRSLKFGLINITKKKQNQIKINKVKFLYVIKNLLKNFIIQKFKFILIFLLASYSVKNVH